MVNINSAIEEMNIIPVVNDKSEKRKSITRGVVLLVATFRLLVLLALIRQLKSGPRLPRASPPCIADVVRVTSAGVARSTPWLERNGATPRTRPLTTGKLS